MKKFFKSRKPTDTPAGLPPSDADGKTAWKITLKI
jgi:hypothetical protein